MDDMKTILDSAGVSLEIITLEEVQPYLKEILHQNLRKFQSNLGGYIIV